MSKVSVPAVLARIAAACATALLVSSQAAAQSFPTHPISLLVPYPPGGAAESLMRAMMPVAGKALGQPLVMENRPGAQGRLALQYQMKNRGDGHLLSFVTNGNVVALPLMDPSFQIQPGRDYAPVIALVLIPMVVTANPSVPFRDMKGLIAHARKYGNSRDFTAGNSGSGGGAHLGMALLADTNKVEIMQIAYKSTAPMTNALLANEVQIGLATPLIKPLVDANRLVALMVTSPKRLSMFPNVPTAIEAGYSALNNVGSWTGFVAPPGTPRDVVARLNSVLNFALKLPESAKLTADVGNVALGGSPDDLVKIIREDFARMGPLVKKLGLKID